jgi:hypothetical protein
MPKSNKCCPSSKSHNNSCVENCVKQCKEQYCKAKYVKLANKLLKTGLIQDSCNYSADRFLDTVAGGKWNWLNNYLINNAVPTVSSSNLEYTNLAPASYGSENAFAYVDESESNFVFALQYNAVDLLNPTSSAGNGIPLVQDVFQYVYNISNLTAPPGSSFAASDNQFGSASLTEILNFASTTSSANGYPALYSYTQAYISAMQQIIAQLPVNQVINGAVGVPLVVEANYTVNNASNVSVNQVARVGLIKFQEVTGVSTGSYTTTLTGGSVSTTLSGLTGSVQTTINQNSIGVTGTAPALYSGPQINTPATSSVTGVTGQAQSALTNPSATTTYTAPVVTLSETFYVLYGYGRDACPSLC